MNVVDHKASQVTLSKNERNKQILKHIWNRLLIYQHLLDNDEDREDAPDCLQDLIEEVWDFILEQNQ